MSKKIDIINPVLKIFMEYPIKEFNIREVSRLVGISPSTASKKLALLAENEFLSERNFKTFRLYRANLENDVYRDLKVYYNIRIIKESGLKEELDRFYLRPTIVLFGSMSNGFDTDTSDIDLVIISEKTEEFPKIEEFEKKLKRELQLFVVKNIKELKNPHLISNVLNGITIQGRVK